MLQELFSMFFDVIDGLVVLDFFIAVMAAGCLYGIASLIRYIFAGDD